MTVGSPPSASPATRDTVNPDDVAGALDAAYARYCSPTGALTTIPRNPDPPPAPTPANASPDVVPPLWRSADWRKLFYAETISTLGTNITKFIIPLVALLLNGNDAFLAGIAGGAYAFFLAVGTLIGGPLTDRTEKRAFIAYVSLILGAIFGLIALLLSWQAINFPIFVACLTAAGFFSGLSETAPGAAMKSLVPSANMVKARSAFELERNIGLSLGAAIGGALLSIASFIPFVLDSLSYAVRAWLVKTIRTPMPGQPHEGGSTFRSDLRVGFQHLATTPTHRAYVIAIVLINIFYPALNLLITLKLFTMGYSALEITSVFAVTVVGAILGNLMLGKLADVLPVGLLSLSGFAFFILMIFGMSQCSTPLHFQIIATLGQIGSVLGSTSLGAYIVSTIPQEKIGRVLSTISALCLFSVPLSQPLFGGLFTLMSPTWCFVVLGTGFTLGLLTLASSREIRELGPTPTWKNT